MADTRLGANHEAHDQELIARVAAGDGSADEVARAASLRAACADCAELDADLRAVALAVRGLGAQDTAVRAPRDFRLTTAEAAKARPGGIGVVVAALRFGLRRSREAAAGGLVALGLVGMLFGSGILPNSALSGAAGAAPTTENLDLKSSEPGRIIVAPVASAAATAPAGRTSTDRSPSAGPSTNGPVLVLSGIIAATGLAFLLAIRRGRRAGP